MSQISEENTFVQTPNFVANKTLVPGMQAAPMVGTDRRDLFLATGHPGHPVLGHPRWKGSALFPGHSPAALCMAQEGLWDSWLGVPFSLDMDVPKSPGVREGRPPCLSHVPQTQTRPSR